MLPYRVQYNEFESNIKNYNLFYQKHQQCQNIFDILEKVSKLSKMSNVYCVICINCIIRFCIGGEVL